MTWHGQKILRTPEARRDNLLDEILTNGWTFQINKAKLYFPVVTFSINDNIKFLENIKQLSKRTISWHKYKSEITLQAKSNNLDYLIDPTFRNINRLFVNSLKHGGNNPTRNYFDEYYLPLIEIKDFTALFDNIPFFYQPVKTNKNRMKILIKKLNQEMITIQQDIY